MKVTERQIEARGRLIALGYSMAGACALIGNFCQESGPGLPSAFRRTRLDHGSQGLPQWRDSGSAKRLTNYQNFVKAMDKRVASDATLLWSAYGNMDFQLQFVDEELRTDYTALHNKLRAGGDVAALTADVCWQYERPNRTMSGIENRIAWAKALALVPDVVKPTRHDPLAVREVARLGVADHLQVKAAQHQSEATGSALASGACGLLAAIPGLDHLYNGDTAWWMWGLLAVAVVGVVLCGLASAASAEKARNLRQALGNVTPGAPSAADVEPTPVADPHVKSADDELADFETAVQAEVAIRLAKLQPNPASVPAVQVLDPYAPQSDTGLADLARANQGGATFTIGHAQQEHAS